MENAAYLFAAFAVVWALVFIYVLILFNRQNRLRQRLETLGHSLKETGKSSD